MDSVEPGPATTQDDWEARLSSDKQEVERPPALCRSVEVGKREKGEYGTAICNMKSEGITAPSCASTLR